MGSIVITTFIVMLFLLCFFWIGSIKDKEKEAIEKHRTLQWEIENKEKAVLEKLKKVEERENDIKYILQNSSPFHAVAEMASDIELILYDNEADYLECKDHPAYSAADTVRKVKEKTRDFIVKLKTLQYKVEFLKNVYPELSLYLRDDSEQDLIELGDANIDLDIVKVSYDRARDYINGDEYRKLSPMERNQLAFDRWIQNVPPSWIGRIYEMYIGQEIKKHRSYKPYNKVDMYGIRRGVNDLGRDIIYYTEGATYIIQCKCWAMHKELHEKTMCQTLGTAVEFKIEREMKYSDWMLIPDTENVVPVVVTPTPLSDMAQRFAKHLKIKVITTKTPIDKIKYMVPLIKCNINNGNKIYHLPFDQQYHRTIIDESKGEFYAMTVKEAEDKGFRRAFRHWGKYNERNGY